MMLAASSAGARTIWLCEPGKRPDPCTPGLSTTVYSPTLEPLGVEHLVSIVRAESAAFARHRRAHH